MELLLIYLLCMVYVKIISTQSLISVMLPTKKYTGSWTMYVIKDENGEFVEVPITVL